MLHTPEGPEFEKPMEEDPAKGDASNASKVVSPWISETQPEITLAHSGFSVGSHTSAEEAPPVAIAISSKEGPKEKWLWMLGEGGKAADSVKSIISAPLMNKDERSVCYLAGKKKVKPSGTAVHGDQPNKMVTARFTLLTWLPLSLMGQFQRVANWYFLFICVIVLFPWSPKRWESKLGPFTFVLLWTALKDLFEDWRRWRDDKAVNSMTAKRVKFRSPPEGTTRPAAGLLATDPSGSAFRPSGDGEVCFEEVTWADVHVGDVLYVPEDAAFPADMLLLHAAGSCEAFISTVMLDGETSLKERTAPGICEVISLRCAREHRESWQAAQTMELDDMCHQLWRDLETQLVSFVSSMGRPGVEIKFAAPSAALGDVRGIIQPLGAQEGRWATSSEESCPFTEANFLPRGCVLRNTRWVLGAVLYVGDDTKTRLNTAKTGCAKFSNMQHLLNHSVWGLLALLLIVCVYATVVSFASAGPGKMAEETDDNVLVKFLKFCIIYYHVVPLSLYVIYEMLKLLLGFRLNTDPGMYDKASDKFATARTADLMEEMGQVDFVFSDKTGTLTANEMVFARCHVNGEDLGDFLWATLGAGPELPPGVARARNVLRGAEDPKLRDVMFERVLDFFTCLSVCHSVVASLTHNVKTETPHSSSSTDLSDLLVPKGLYAGPSPDEVALVEAAHAVGIRFERRVRQQAGTVTDLHVVGPGELRRKFALLYELPFSSDRKRMSVILRHKGTIYCVTKGADSVMERLLTEPFTQKCKDDISKFSRQGLRTLIIAMKKVPVAEFEDWNARYAEARNLIDASKDEMLAKVAAEMEQGLRFVGVTAVEDRLQVGVPEAIATMKDMGIRVWVLTGDKTETAVDIARSCHLFRSSTTLSYVVGASSCKDAEASLQAAHSELSGREDAGIVLDGQTLVHALTSKECRKLIYDLGIVSRSCVCCRLSPKQKLELVQLVREHNTQAITLSIGDGANDVPMIYGAHVGVAVRGKEGTQAVQASDVAISRFKFVVPLLQCHGRRAYRRIASFICYFFYKNLGLIMLDLIWMHQNRFTATPALAEWLSINYNVFFTSFHVLFVLGFDSDVPDRVALDTPSLYKVGPQRALFNAKVFAKWLLQGLWHGAVAWCVPYYIFSQRDGLSTKDYSEDEPTIFWVCSVTALTSMIFIVCLKLILVCENPLSKYTLLPTAAAWVIYMCIVLGISEVGLAHTLQPNLKGIAGEFFGNSSSYLSLLLALVIGLTPDIIEQAVMWLCFPTALQVARWKKAPSVTATASSIISFGGRLSFGGSSSSS